MPRSARVVIPGHPHHIIQRGNRRQQVFFGDADKQTYLDYLEEFAKPAGLEIWAYCLMDNHVHLIAVPEKEDSLAVGLKDVHVRYTRMINFREGWRGYLWEGRFKSHPLSESHLYAAIRYVERNPVRARLVNRAEEYQWSSAKAHVTGEKSSLLAENFMLTEIRDWSSYLQEESTEQESRLFQQHVHTGRPLGDDTYMHLLEKITGKSLERKKPGPKKNN